MLQNAAKEPCEMPGGDAFNRRSVKKLAVTVAEVPFLSCSPPWGDTPLQLPALSLENGSLV